MNMTELLQPAEKGIARIDHFTIADGDFRARMEGIPNGIYARLKINGNIVMGDTPMERRTNSNFIRSCFGDILIGGLGLGMVLMDIWEYINSDVYQKEMKPLIAKYRRYLKPKSEDARRNVSCWA